MLEIGSLPADVQRPNYDRSRLKTMLEQLPPPAEILHRDWLENQLKQQLER